MRMGDATTTGAIRAPGLRQTVNFRVQRVLNFKS